jgi:hypothetical protein
MKKAIAFLAGAIFTAALIVTCGGGGSGGGGGAGGAGSPTTNAGPIGPGVGDARAQTQPAVRTAWQYAFLSSLADTQFQGPAGVVENFSTCPGQAVEDEWATCALNVLGADGWELVAAEFGTYPRFYFKRPQQ